jgi:hypothetical protein
MAYGRYQIRVRLRDRTVHSSGTPVYENAELRCQQEVIIAGLGAIGTVWEFNTQQSPKPDEHKMVRQYEVRLMYDASKSDGSTTLVHEDHTTPPPLPPEHHV